MGLQALRRFFCWGFDVFTLSLRKKQNIMEDDNQQKRDTLDFGPVEDTTKEIIKVVGVGGGGCNAVNNMFNEGIATCLLRFAIPTARVLPTRRYPSSCCWVSPDWEPGPTLSWVSRRPSRPRNV